MHVVESAENDKAVAEFARARETDVDDASAAEAMRQQRLKSLPTSLPVGGIITPV
jgi:hypothetical protein